ncbi:MAG TPA: RNA polymerase subunit sigma-24, partial [Dehalococcoidia bacterium]
MPADAAQAVDQVYRAEWGRIVAALIQQLGDFDLAEEVAQDAFVAALDQWSTTGIPSYPRAWILQ